MFRPALDVGADEHSDESRCRLLCAAASAMHLAGDFDGRLDACVEAAAVARLRDGLTADE